MPTSMILLLNMNLYWNKMTYIALECFWCVIIYLFHFAIYYRELDAFFSIIHKITDLT